MQRVAGNLGAMASEAWNALMAPGRAASGQYPTLVDASAPGGVDPYGAMIPDALNLATTLDAGGMAIPAPESALGIFGGAKSLTADARGLNLAKMMEAAGHSPDKIIGKTGWFRGADGEWKYEIPDASSTVPEGSLPRPQGEGEPLRVGDNVKFLDEVLQHPKLFAAYPEARDIMVSTTPEEGVASGTHGYFSNRMGQPTITLLAGDPRDVALHELQHWVQRKEGFARGGNEGYAAQFAPGYAQHAADITQQISSHMTNWTQNWLKDRGIDRPSGLDQDQAFSAWQKAHPELDQQWDEAAEDASRTTGPHAAWHTYARFGGEVEARNVQARKNFSEQMLEAYRPWDTQEFSGPRQIIVKPGQGK